MCLPCPRIPWRPARSPGLTDLTQDVPALSLDLLAPSASPGNPQVHLPVDVRIRREQAHRLANRIKGPAFPFSLGIVGSRRNQLRPRRVR